MNLVKEMDQKYTEGRVPPLFRVGDTVSVHTLVTEGNRERIQIFTGFVMAIKKSLTNYQSSFTVRKVSYGDGVEKVFHTYGSSIAKIELKRKGKVRKAKLYFMRKLRGKKARIKEKIR